MSACEDPTGVGSGPTTIAARSRRSRRARGRNAPCSNERAYFVTISRSCTER
jgi:hypothetical protein